MLGYGEPLAALTPPWIGAGGSRASATRAGAGLMAEVAWPDGHPLTIATPGAFEGIARMIAADVADALGLATAVVVVPDEDLVGGALSLVEKKLTAVGHPHPRVVRLVQ